MSELMAKNPGNEGGLWKNMDKDHIGKGFPQWDDMKLIEGDINDKEWLDLGLDGVSYGIDTLGEAMDPTGSLISAGLAWLVEHFAPFKNALDWLAGDPNT